MKTTRITGLFALLCTLAALPLAAQQNDGFVGNWSGALSEGGGGPAERFLAIKAVQPDGTATGGWGNTQDKLLPATITIENGVLTLSTRGNATFVLKLEGERLVGSMATAKGGDFPVSFTRTPATMPAEEIFAGSAPAASSACNASAYDVEVVIRGNRVAGFWTASRKYNFGAELVGDEFKTIVAFDATNKVQLSGQRRGAELQFNAGSSRGCTFGGKLARK